MNNNGRLIFVTGGTGFVGSALIRAWLNRDPSFKVIVQTRSVNQLPEADSATEARLRYVSAYSEVDEPVYGIVNLAGAPIAEKRWTKRRKRVLEDSRIELTKTLFSQVKNSRHQPEVVVSASAIGFYGTGNDSVDEGASKGDGYAANLCRDWEAAAAAFDSISRLVILRLGVVLGMGGMIEKLMPIYKLGLGGKIASGHQWLSWVHLQDAVGLIIHALCTHDMAGVYNATSPQPRQQQDFARELAKVLSRPSFLTTPGFALTAIFGEMANELLIGGQKVLPQRTQDSGFEFRHPELKSALNDIVKPVEINPTSIRR